jgi:two-component system sensor histidine kinase UhpB
VQKTRFNAIFNNENEEHSGFPVHNGSEGQLQALKRFSPTGLLFLVILVAFIAEGVGIILETFMEQAGRHSGLLIHSVEMLIFLASAFFLLYLPLKRRLMEREKMVLVMRESEKHLQQVMQEREQHLRLALEGSSSGLWDWDLVSGKAYFSPSSEHILGYLPGELELSIQTWENLLNPEDRENVMKALRDHLEGRSPFYETEHRVRSKSGEWVWFHAMGRVTARDRQGRPLRIIGTFNNVTDRKKADAEIHLLWQQLDRAGENERARLAQDLHDQLGQMVTGLQLGLGVFKREQVDRCQKLIDLTTQLGNEIRNVTARLRPPALDTGLIPALEYDLDHLHLHDLRVNLYAPGLERERLEPEAEITLFRIYQEAINNAIKHARGHTIDIRLQREGAEIILSVKDDGVGFNVQQAFSTKKDQKGIGLLGMQERVAALGGRLEIISGPLRGTTVLAILPYRPAEPKGIS